MQYFEWWLCAKEMRPVVGESFVYDTLDTQMKDYLNQSVLKRLMTNTSLLHLDPATDGDYQMYVNNMAASQTKRLLVVAELLGNFDNAGAVAAINDLDETNTLLALNKTVQTIWNNSILSGEAISADDTLVLKNIACQDPLEMGSGVYQARAVLDWNEECMSVGLRNASASVSPSAVVQTSAVIYPNPSNGQFEIKSNKIISTVTIFDLNGSVVYQQLSNFDSVDCSNHLKTGIYIVQIQLEDGTLEKHKIVFN